jgi:alpha-N-arabinofuranosidase
MRKLLAITWKKEFRRDNKKLIVIFLICFSSWMNINGYAFAEDGAITVYCDKTIGFVNKKVFGNNFIGYDPMTIQDWWAKEFYGYSDYGGGVWDPKRKESVKEVIRLARDAGVTILRFPGGCGVHRYNWKDTIGKKRKHFLYGIDEFLKTCSEIGAEAVMTVSYFTGDERDASDLIEYLNSPHDGKNPNGGVDWAAERARNGHPKPYNVKYFEIGNEVWHGDHRNIKTWIQPLSATLISKNLYWSKII